MKIVSDVWFYWFVILLIGGTVIGWGGSEIVRARRYRREKRNDPDEVFGLFVGFLICLLGTFSIVAHFAGWI